MEKLYYSVGISSIIYSIAWVWVTIIREKEKRKRIKLLKHIDNSKVEAIGNYEQKSKSQVNIVNPSKIKKDSEASSE